MNTATIYAAVGLLFAIVFMIVFILNAYFYGKIFYFPTETDPVSRSTAGALFWTNIILAILAFAFLVYSGYAIFASQSLTCVKKSVCNPSPAANEICALKRPSFSDDAVCAVRPAPMVTKTEEIEYERKSTTIPNNTGVAIRRPTRTPSFIY